MSAGRRLSVFLGGAAAAAALTVLMIREGPQRTDLPGGISAIPDWVSADPEHALTTVVGLAAWACLLWLCGGFVLGVLAMLPGVGGRAAAAVARRVLPRTMRHVLEIALGVTIAAGTAAPALAATPMDAPIPAAIPSTGTAWPDLTRPNVATALSPTDLPPAPQLAPPQNDRRPVLQQERSTSSQATAGQPVEGERPATPPPRAFTPAPVTVTPMSAPTATSWPDLSRPASPPTPASPVIAPTSTRPVQSSAGNSSTASANPPATGPQSTASAIPSARSTTSAAAPQAVPTTVPTGPSALLLPTVSDVSAVASATETSPVWPDLSRPADPMIGSAPLGVGNSGTAPNANPGPAGQATTPAHTNDASTAELTEVVVLRGDTLWAIAARALGPAATTAQIAREWPRWWAANEQVIGPDPDRILPGQRLQPPRPGP